MNATFDDSDHDAENESDDVSTPVYRDMETCLTYAVVQLSRERRGSNADKAEGQQNNNVALPTGFSDGLEASVVNLRYGDLRGAKISILVTHFLYTVLLGSRSSCGNRSGCRSRGGCRSRRRGRSR